MELRNSVMYILIKLVIILNLAGSASSTCYSDESCLYDQLMTNYNDQVRPATGPSGTVTVNIILELNNLLGLDEKNEVLSSVLSITSEWRDHFLSWGSSNYTSIQLITIGANKLWVPDFAVTNSVENFYQKTFREDFRVHITSAGDVIWQFGGIFKTTCSLDISKYPFDTQSCSIVIENWSYTESLVNLTGGTLITANMEANSLWDLTASVIERSSYQEANVDYPRLKYTFTLARKTRYYIFNIILPCTLVLFAALGVFWLPADCGEKISLGITVLLAFSVFQIVIMDNTPVNSDTTPFISMLVMTIMSLATVSVVSSMLTIFLHFKGATSRVPKWLRIVAFKGLAKVLFLKDDVKAVQAEMDEINDSKNQVRPLEPEFESNESVPIDKKSGKPKSELGLILEQLLILNDKMSHKQLDEAIVDEWKLLAKIIDRTFFWICLLVLVITIAAISPS